MSNFLIAFILFSTIFVLQIISLIVGRVVGRWKITKHETHKLEVISVTEGAVFALLGLLIAFTFTGAFDRFEEHESRIIDEANYLDIAYLRLDLLEPTSRAIVKKTFLNYVNARIEYMIELSQIETGVSQQLQATSIKLQHQLWNEAIDGLRATHDTAATELILPALNDVIDIANTRAALIQMHMPFVIMVFLIGLAMISTFYAGYSTARKHIHSSVYILTYVLIISVTLYIIIDLEIPRSGIIRVQGLENILIHIKADMQKVG